jgi:hypothetical protein
MVDDEQEQCEGALAPHVWRLARVPPRYQSLWTINPVRQLLNMPYR